MTKLILSLTMVGMMMLAGNAFAHETESMGNTYKAMEKAEHVKAFPQGHPVTKNALNRCFWDEADGLFFCQYPIYQGGAN